MRETTVHVKDGYVHVTATDGTSPEPFPLSAVKFFRLGGNGREWTISVELDYRDDPLIVWLTYNKGERERLIKELNEKILSNKE